MRMVPITLRNNTLSAQTTAVSTVIPFDGFIAWVDLHSALSAQADFTGPQYSYCRVGTNAEYNGDGIWVYGGFSSARHASADPFQSGSHMGKFCQGLWIPIAAGSRVFLWGESSAGCAGTHFATMGLTDEFFFSKHKRNQGHVSRFTRLKVSFNVTKKSLLTSKVVTLFDAREAVLSALGQLLYAGELVLGRDFLWSSASIPVGPKGIELPAAPTLQASELLQLIDGYYSQGFDYLENHLSFLGRLTLGKRKLQDVYPDFRALETDPISLAVIELLERALSQKNPRQWVTAHFRSRSVLGLAERPE